MSENTYWRPKPKRHDAAWWFLLLPAIVYSCGVIVYAHNAFVPGLQEKNGHAIGSAMMVLGGEIGTLAAAGEVFRKQAHGETNALDWGGLVVSLIATLGNLFVVYVSLAPDFVAPWAELVRRIGPLVLLLCSGIDFYAGIMEFGFYNASFEKRYESWLLGKRNSETRDARRTQETQVSATKTKPSQVAAQPTSENETIAQLTDRQKQIVEILRETPGATKTSIAETLGVSRTTIANDMKAMEV